jgi:hypothetical protein
MGIAVGDLDKDGKLDLVVANSQSSNLTVLLGNGNGTFVAQSPFVTAAGPYAVVVADFNNDGRADMVSADFGYNGISVILSRCQ